MATNQRTRERRPYGSLAPENTAKLYSILDKDAKDFFDDLADGAGVSMAVLLEALALHLRDEATETDVSNWLDAWRDLHQKKRNAHQEALDISAA